MCSFIVRMLKLYKHCVLSVQTDVAEAAEFQNWEVTDTKFQQQNLLPDPGAHTVAIWVRAVVEALKTPYSQASIAGSSSFCSGIDDFMYYP